MHRPSRWWPGLRAAAIVCAGLLALGGCTTVDPNFARMNDTVVPVPVGEVTAVPAMALAKAMLRAGFTRQQILDHGTEVRNALATAGGAQVRQGNTVDAIFAVHAQELYVTSQTEGTFMQELFPTAPPSSSACATRTARRCSSRAATGSRPSASPKPVPSQ